MTLPGIFLIVKVVGEAVVVVVVEEKKEEKEEVMWQQLR